MPTQMTGGPTKCPRPCEDCADGAHHFTDGSTAFGEESPGHAAEKAGHEYWNECLHCDAWTAEDVDEEDDS